jgi:transcriptional regulator with GAF, ATPase, and Fis domain
MAGARVVVQRGPDKGRSLKLEREEVVIGTAPSCDLVLTDRTVSRNHLSIRVLGDGYLATDLESTNGTRIEDRRIRTAFLEPGDRFDLGGSRLKLEPLKGRVELSLSEDHSFGALLGRSVVARRLFAQLAAVAPESINVLLLGETGSGKDLAAEAIHQASPRARGPFIAVDCGALASGVLESELFGHVRGAFTDAHSDRVGAFAAAHGGTLFLDEIGELALDLQPKLLRAIERRVVRPVGGDPLEVDVRLIAATNRDLRLEVNRGTFREDLFYRLSTFPIRVPPLRERADDIPLLAEHFRRLLTHDADGAFPREWIESLLAQSWPGNVRELRNRVERAVVTERIGTGMFALEPEATPAFVQAKTAAVDAFERQFLTALMLRAGGNQSEAARVADMDRVYLGKLLRKHGLHAKK